MSSSVEVIDTCGERLSTSSSTTVPASLMPCSAIAAPTASPCAPELRGEVDVDPLRLAGLRAEILERVADLQDLCVRELEGLEDRVREPGFPPRSS
jgi:hypothetical protein